MRGWSHRAAVAGSGVKGAGTFGSVVPSVCVLFVFCSFLPKNTQQTESRSHGAARPAAEVLRGWRGKGGSGKGGRRDQSRS